MHRRSRWAGALSLTVAAGLAIAGCGGGASDSGSSASSAPADTSAGTSTGTPAATTQGGHLRIGYSIAAVTTLDPAKVSAQTEQNFTSLVTEELTQLDKDGKPQPKLATKWSVSPDKLTWTFTLRPNVTFSDGTAMDAAAVKYSLDRALAKSTGSSLASSLGPISKVTVAGPLKVKVTTARPYAPLPSALSYTPSAIVSPKAAKAAGLDKFGLKPVGTGPYTVSSFTPHATIEYAANPTYWGDKPSFDQITATFFQEEPTLVSSLQAGSLDVGWQLGPADIQTLQGTSGVNVVTGAGYTVTYFGFNAKKAPWSDPKVRLAISHAINVPQILKVALLDHATPIAGPIGPGVVGYNPDEKPVTYDPELAKKMLQEAGVKDGQQMTVYIPVDPIRQRIVSLMQQDLKQVGINVKPVVQDFGAHLAAVMAGEEDMFSLTWGNGTGDADSSFASFCTDCGPNFTHFSNPEVDKLIEQEQSDFDPQSRIQVIHQTLDALKEQAPWIPMWAAQYIVGVRDNVQGFQVVPSGNFDQMLANAAFTSK